MARFIARQAVITELRRRGHKEYRYCSAKDLTEMADAYVKTHRQEVLEKVVVWMWEDAWKKVRAKRGKLVDVD